MKDAKRLPRLLELQGPGGSLVMDCDTGLALVAPNREPSDALSDELSFELPPNRKPKPSRD